MSGPGPGAVRGHRRRTTKGRWASCAWPRPDRPGPGGPGRDRHRARRLGRLRGPDLRQRNVPALVVRSKADLGLPALELPGVPQVAVSALQGTGILDLREALCPATSSTTRRRRPAPGPGGGHPWAVPIDKEAPLGPAGTPAPGHGHPRSPGWRGFGLGGAGARAGLTRLNRRPALVVTDDQAFLKVAADVPRSVPMTSFSIHSRFQGDLAEQVRAGHRAAEGRRPGPDGRDLQPPPGGRGHRAG